VEHTWTHDRVFSTNEVEACKHTATGICRCELIFAGSRSSSAFPANRALGIQGRVVKKAANQTKTVKKIRMAIQVNTEIGLHFGVPTKSLLTSRCSNTSTTKLQAPVYLGPTI